MVDENLTESQEELDDPMSADELLINLMQDLLFENDANDLATDFIDEFVLRDRPETPQILAMFEMPSESLVEMLKGVCEQSHQTQIQALNERGIQYLENLKTAVRTLMTEIAESN